MIGLLLGQAVALLAGLLCVPCAYFTRRNELRLRSKNGALGWAIVDGYGVWVLISCVVAGVWVARHHLVDRGLAYIVAFAFFLVGMFLADRTSPTVAKLVMRKLGA